MNYYNPNYYMNNYPYNNQYQPQTPYQSGNTGYNASFPGASALNGKIVDSADVVKATEVPIGGYGIFPKADLSEIYIKSWNNNGTTSILTFKPIVSAEEQIAIEDISNLDRVIEKIESLETKIDSLIPKPKNNLMEVPKNDF